MIADKLVRRYAELKIEADSVVMDRTRIRAFRAEAV
jgi:hypothetical protein